MHLRLPLLLLCGCLCTCVRAQIDITGIILDSLNGDPVPFATVYIDGTSAGDVTADNGTFTIKNVRLPGMLVVSHLNYETKRIGLTTYSDPIRVGLKSREAVIEGVEVNDRNGRTRNLEEFKRIWIGSDDWAQRSELKLQNNIVFSRDYERRETKVFNASMRTILRERNRPSAEWSEDSTTYSFERAVNLKAITKGPVNVVLPHLGYVVRVDLKSFQADYNAGRNTHLGTFFYQPATKVKKIHLRNRRKAYLGSTMHFARALLDNALTDNGFRVFEVTKDPHGGDVTTEYDIRQHLRQADDVGYSLTKLRGRQFAILYYANANGEPLGRDRWKRAQPVQSRLFVDSDYCRIYEGGVFGDPFLAFTGEMGRRGLAWSLPNDYVFDGR